MLGTLLRSWWVMVVRGLFAILFGIITLTWTPVWSDITVFVIVTIFGAFFMLDGLIEIWVGFAARGSAEHWWTDALPGVLSVILGTAIIAWPGITAIALMYAIAGWMVVIGGVMVYQGLRLREDVSGELSLLTTGALSLVLGFGFMIVPVDDAVRLAWLIGAWIIVFGALLVRTGWRIGRIERGLHAEASRQP